MPKDPKKILSSDLLSILNLKKNKRNKKVVMTRLKTALQVLFLTSWLEREEKKTLTM